MVFSQASSSVVATGLWDRRDIIPILQVRTLDQGSKWCTYSHTASHSYTRSPHSSGWCSFCWALLPLEKEGTWSLRSFCVISIKTLPSPSSRGQHVEEWGLAAWHPHLFFASVGLSQAAGCPSFAMSSLLQHIYLVLLLRLSFSVPWSSQSLMSRSCSSINLPRGRKEETGYEFPQILPTLLPPTQYRPSQRCICLVNCVLLKNNNNLFYISNE